MLRYQPVVHVITSGGSDLASWLVAGGTLALAVATAVLAWKTRSMANETRDLAAETRNGIAVSTTQFRQERMPVVMPIAVVSDNASELQMKLPYPRSLDQDKVEVRIFIPIENVGAGPALDIRASLYWLDQNGARSVSSTQPFETRKAALPALGPGHEQVLTADFRGLAIAPMMAFRLTISYRDGAGGDYEVEATFYPKTKSYGPIGFLPPKELQLPGSPSQPIPMPEGVIRNRLTGEVVNLSDEIAPDVNDLGIPPEDDPDGSVS